MKYILIGDNHWGIKKFNNKIFNIQLNLYKNQIIPYMKENNINTIIHMGDLFDNRVIVDINFFNRFINEFIFLLKENNIEFITIIGNHDIYLSNSLEINLVKMLPYFYNKIKVIDKITDIKNMTLIPWIISDNELPNKYNEIILGHFEFQNIDKMITGKYDYNHFSEAKLVLSGHYHNYSKNDNVIYLGTPYQLTWNDYSQRKGFYVFDNELIKLDFIENNTSPKHIKIIYNNQYKSLLIKGFNKDKFLELNDNDFINELKKHKIKFIIETDGNYEEIIYKLKQELHFEIINEAKIIEISKINLNENIKIESSESILENIPTKYKNIMQEIINFQN